MKIALVLHVCAAEHLGIIAFCLATVLMKRGQDQYSSLQVLPGFYCISEPEMSIMIFRQSPAERLFTAHSNR